MTKRRRVTFTVGYRGEAHEHDMEYISGKARHMLEEIRMASGDINAEVIISFETTKEDSSLVLLEDKMNELRDLIAQKQSISTDEKLYDVPLSQRIDDPISDVDQEGLDEL